MFYTVDNAMVSWLSRMTHTFLAGPTGLEPATSSVTGKRSNQTELRSHAVQRDATTVPNTKK